jgi:predicted acyltransferase
MIAVAIDWDKLLEAAYISAAFGIGVIAVAGVAVVASLQGQDRRRVQRSAIPFDVLATVCVVAIVASIVLGIYIMTDK